MSVDLIKEHYNYPSDTFNNYNQENTLEKEVNINTSESTDVQNPFYITNRGGNVYKNQKVLSMVTSVLIVVMLNNSTTFEDIKKFTKKVLSKNCNYNLTGITTLRVSKSITNNKKHLFRASFVTDDELHMFFPHEHFNAQEIVIPMFELSKDKIFEYVSLYQCKQDLIKFNTNLNVINSLSTNFNNKLIINLIKNIDGNNYWTNQFNTKINVTTIFTERNFQSKNTDKIVKVTKETAKALKDTEDDLTTNDYPVNKKPNDRFSDITTYLHSGQTTRTFFATIPEVDITVDLFNDIYSKLTTIKDKYYFLINTLISKEYCHLVVNNKKILQENLQLIKEYLGAFKYAFGYAWLTLYFEECIFLNKTTKKHRYAIDIHTAQHLPQFPFSLDNLKLNPYLTLLIHNEQLNIKNNCIGIKPIANYTGYGVTDLDTFKRRLNLFITKQPDKDIFNGLDWNFYGLSGSIIPACLPKRTPLLDVLIKTTNGNSNEAFLKYIDKYYSSSDIDIMCNELNFIEYIKKAKSTYELIKTNTESKDNETSFETIKTMSVSITKFFFECTLQDFNNQYNLAWTLKEYEDNVNDFRVRSYLYGYYAKYKQMQNTHIIKNNPIIDEFLSNYLEFFSIHNFTIYVCDDTLYTKYKQKETDIILRQSDFVKDKNFSDDKIVMKIGDSVRFKFNFPKIGRQIEFFRSNSKDFFSLAAHFHLPCVRAYYQGDNVYMTPSCITSMMTLINIEYKYFAGIRDPIDIINKYNRRGFGVILNSIELDQYKKFNENSDKYKLGPKTVYDPIFENVITNEENSTMNEYVYSENDAVINMYNELNSNIDSTRFNSINETGKINKLIPSFFELYFDTSN